MFINATGIACPAGLSAASACAAKRSGISALNDTPYRDNAGGPIVGGAVSSLDWTTRGARRLRELLAISLIDVMNSQARLPWDRVPLIVCVAERERPGTSEEVAATIVASVEQDLSIKFHPKHSRVVASGHVAGFEALQEARILLERGGAPACLVCGVDSFLNPTTLHWLDENYRLKTPGNRDGLIPGEAATCLMLQTRPMRDLATQVIGIGFGTEQAPNMSDMPLLGRGLTDAVRAALAEAELGLHEVDLRLSDVTGELYGFKELSLVEARLMRTVRKEAQPLWHWAEAIGDSGAAAGVAQMILADEAFRKNYAPGQHAICLTSSVSGKRASVVLRRYQG